MVEHVPTDSPEAEGCPVEQSHSKVAFLGNPAGFANLYPENILLESLNGGISRPPESSLQKTGDQYNHQDGNRQNESKNADERYERMNSEQHWLKPARKDYHYENDPETEPKHHIEPQSNTQFSRVNAHNALVR